MDVSTIGNNKRSSRLKKVTQSSKEPSYTCKVCEATAIHSNFGVTSCSACKMFFKRNAEMKRGYFTCDFSGDCEINVNTRHVCSACRLAKCFANGMQTELIRCSTSKTKGKKKLKNELVNNNQLQKLTTINLLELDRSVLTTDQWNRLLNITRCYDEQSGLSLAERLISEQNVLPIKLRFKCGPVREFVSSLINKVQLLFEKNHDFLSLCAHDRSILLRRQMKYVAIISFAYIVQQTHLIEHPAFCSVIKILFGKIAMSTTKRVNDLLSADVSVLKLALAIICFSTFDYTGDENIPENNLRNIKPIMHIQNMYIELAWRYLIHQYNSKQAIIYFSNLIKYIFTVNDTLMLMQDEKNFTDIIDSAIQRTEQMFTVRL